MRKPKRDPAPKFKSLRLLDEKQLKYVTGGRLVPDKAETNDDR